MPPQKEKFMPLTCYVKGKWKDAETATLSIQERGFRFGDGVFETIRVEQGIPLFLSRHLERLHSGLAAIRIPSPAEDIRLLCHQLVQKNAAADTQHALLRLSVSRGIGSRGYLPIVTTPPTVVMELLPLPTLPPLAPARLWLSSIRRSSADSAPIAYKLMQGMNLILARMEAEEHHCHDALLLNPQEEIAEASSSSIFWQDSAGNIITPALSCGILASISRAVLLEAFAKAGITVQEGHYSLTDLQAATDVFTCNVAMGVRAVTTIEPLGWKFTDTSLSNMAEGYWQQALRHEANHQPPPTLPT
jgi:branched-subunit amino acid aminotransferase/4-amino-4-deoxychorismate lyase